MWMIRALTSLTASHAKPCVGPDQWHKHINIWHRYMIYENMLSPDNIKNATGTSGVLRIFKESRILSSSLLLAHNTILWNCEIVKIAWTIQYHYPQCLQDSQVKSGFTASIIIISWQMCEIGEIDMCVLICWFMHEIENMFKCFEYFWNYKPSCLYSF